ncbi:DUF3857 domain-containing protein [Flavobacterium sp.]|uniref:transglutaminase domain-containing protein n=1 Tax=Flavobacterium sp. TaxID=239 RepID=UPI00286E24C0|nr:DUF3857 domain-containing protein [Flavobacterium sp.]
MFLKKSLIALLFLVSFSKTKAQDFEMGKVSLAELQEKVHPIDTSAVAAILFKTGKSFYALSSITKVKTRIKIYKKEGYKFANQGVQHFKGQPVIFTNAVTYNLVDGKIEKTKLQSDGEFNEVVNKYRFRKKITMPNVKVGSVIEFEYEMKSEGYGFPLEWQFQSSIPVNYSKYETTISDNLVFKTSFKGFIIPKITKNKKGNMDTHTTYLLENIPAINKEVYVNNIDNYKSTLNHEIAIINVPGRIYKEFSTDWNAVVKTIYEEESFDDELNKTDYFEDDLDALIKGLNTPDEKITAIFEHVKESVKWNQYTDFFCDEGVRKAYKDKTGNVAEINLMLTAMLRYAGLNANPVILSTRSKGIALLPSIRAFNYVIAAIETQEGIVLLDATEKYASPNVLPVEDLNGFGRLIRKDGTSTQVSLTPQTQSKEVTNMNLILGKDGVINGKIRIQLSNHNALAFRQKNLITTTDTYLEGIENQNNNIEISDYVRENDLDLSKPIVEGYAFKDSKSIEIINDKIYVSPLLFLATKENPFKQEIREYPVDFSYPFQNKYNVSITIPEGFIVETLPAPINIATGENIGSFKYVTGTTGNKVQISITLDINTAIVSEDYYDVLKAFYQQMIDKQNEKIVLKKI